MANSNRPRRAHRVVVPATFALVAVAVASLAGCSSSAKSAPPPPQPPTDVTVTGATGPAGSVSFKPPAAPASNDHSTVSGYTAACTSSSAGTKTQAGSASPITVTNLSVGHAYTCTVKAQGPGGTSAPSAPSASFTPVTAPGAPNAGSGVPYGPTQVKLLWNPPASAGGSPVTGYSVKPYLGGAVQPVIKFTSTKTVQILGNLRTGGTYLFQIAAVNAIGTGAWSPKSGPVTVGTPGQPGSVKAAKAAPGQLPRLVRGAGQQRRHDQHLHGRVQLLERRHEQHEDRERPGRFGDGRRSHRRQDLHLPRQGDEQPGHRSELESDDSSQRLTSPFTKRAPARRPRTRGPRRWATRSRSPSRSRFRRRPLPARWRWRRMRRRCRSDAPPHTP